MQNKDSGFYSAVGLARKAGKLMAGTNACLEGIRKGRAGLAIVTEDTAANTLGKISSACEQKGVELLVKGDSTLLGKSIGRSEIKVVVVTDRELTKLILSKAI